MDRSELNVLIKDVKKQDEIAFQKLFDACKKEVFGFLYLYTKNSKDAKNLLQKTFVKIRETVHEQRDGIDAFAWILKAAHITAIDYLKVKNKQSDDNTESKEICKDNKKRKGALPSVYEIINNNFEDTDRQIVLLKLAYGYKNKEIANILNIPIATVPWKYNNAIKSLKNILLEAGYQVNNIGNLILAENEEADIEFFSDMTKTPIIKPAESENENETRGNFFKSASFISAVCCLTVALILFLITCL